MQEFFKENFRISLPLVMSGDVELNEEGYQDIQWWLDAQNETRQHVRVELIGPKKVPTDIYNVNLYRPMSLLTNYRPVVFRWQTLLLAFDGPTCDVASGSVYDIWNYCGFANRSEVNECVQCNLCVLPVRDGRPRYITSRHYVICEEIESTEQCLQRMSNRWMRFQLWYHRGEPHNQVQARCKAKSLRACGFNRNSTEEMNQCLAIQRIFPHIELFTLHYGGLSECQIGFGQSSPVSKSCYLNTIVRKSRGFQKVRLKS